MFRDEDWATPIDSPAYPRPPSHYEDVTVQSVFFRATPAQIQQLLPHPLTPDSDGRCCAFAIDAKFCAQLGPFREMGVAVGCQFDGKFGFFLAAHFVNTPETIAPGREVYGSPKKYAQISMTQQGGEWTTTAMRAGVQIIQINSRLIEPVEPDRVPALFPLYKLRTIPGATGGPPDVKQLLCGGAPTNVKTDRLFQGPGVVSFAPTVAGDFWRLQPLRFELAIYQRCSFELGFSDVALSYSSTAPQ